jgi:hypothetical protein
MPSKKDQRLRFNAILLLSLGSGLLACIVCVLLLAVLNSNHGDTGWEKGTRAGCPNWQGGVYILSAHFQLSAPHGRGSF